MKSVGLMVSVALAMGVLSGGCQNGQPSTSGAVAEKTGSLALPLVTTGPSGVEYRLRDANFLVTGYGDQGYTDEVVSSEEDPSADSISLDVEQGSYTILLQPGWHMEKVVGGIATPVEAQLLGENRQYVMVLPHSTSWANFQFGIGGRSVWLNGKLNLEIQVYENPMEVYGGVGDEILTPDVLESGWIGGDPLTSADDPAGIQGGIYAYGDQIATIPPAGNPCGPEGCCIDYRTVTDPTYAAWGGGIGLSLGAMGEGSTMPRNPYMGTAQGFEITYTNTGAAAVRIEYAQTPDTNGQVSPFIAGRTGTQTVMFYDVMCPSWGWDLGCLEPTMNPYDVRLQIEGGSSESSGKLCITSIKPVYNPSGNVLPPPVTYPSGKVTPAAPATVSGSSTITLK